MKYKIVPCFAVVGKTDIHGRRHVDYYWTEMAAEINRDLLNEVE